MQRSLSVASEFGWSARNTRLYFAADMPRPFRARTCTELARTLKCCRATQNRDPLLPPPSPFTSQGPPSRTGLNPRDTHAFMITSDARIEQIEARLDPLRQQLLSHPLYGRLESPDDLRIFMEHHVFAVWDFMSLLKALQLELTGVSVPWLPARWPFACRMINEIVLAEESDEDGEGGFASHFELYRGGMLAAGADPSRIDRLVDLLREGVDLEVALMKVEASHAVQQFVLQTFRVVRGGEIAAVAAAFTFGREDLLPDVFQRIVDEMNDQTEGSFELFQYYLARHIELDGETHGPLARQLLQVLCGDDDARWMAAEEAAVSSLESRRDLWDEIHRQLEERRVNQPALNARPLR